MPIRELASWPPSCKSIELDLPATFKLAGSSGTRAPAQTGPPGANQVPNQQVIHEAATRLFVVAAHPTNVRHRPASEEMATVDVQHFSQDHRTIQSHAETVVDRLMSQDGGHLPRQRHVWVLSTERTHVHAIYDNTETKCEDGWRCKPTDAPLQPPICVTVATKIRSSVLVMAN